MELICAGTAISLIIMVGAIWLLVKILEGAVEEKKNREAMLRWWELTMMYGTPEEKTNVLLEMQNAKLDELNSRASWAAVYFITHGGPPGSGPINKNI